MYTPVRVSLVLRVGAPLVQLKAVKLAENCVTMPAPILVKLLRNGVPPDFRSKLAAEKSPQWVQSKTPSAVKSTPAGGRSVKLPERVPPPLLTKIVTGADVAVAPPLSEVVAVTT